MSKRTILKEYIFSQKTYVVIPVIILLSFSFYRDYYIGLLVLATILVATLALTVNDFIKLKDEYDRLNGDMQIVRDLFDVTPDIFVWVDKDFRLVKYEGNSKILTKPWEQMKGRTIFDVFTEEQSNYLYDHIIKTIQENDDKIEFCFTNHDGEELKYFTMNTVFIPHSNMILTMTRDVTQRVNAEKRIDKNLRVLRLLTERAQDIIYLITVYPEKRYEFVSSSTINMLGYTHDMFLDDYYFMNKILVSDRDRKVLEKSIKKVINTKKPLIAEYQVLRNDGSIIWVENSMVFVEDDDAKAIEGIIRDITTKKISEQRMIIQNKELREYVQITSHDFKTPLRTLQGLVSVFEDDYKNVIDEDGAHLLSRIKSSSVRLITLIEAMHEYAIISETSINFTSIHVYSFLHEIRKKYNELFIDIICTPYNIEIYADLDMMKRVVTELIDNAIKFTDEPIAITINCRVYDYPFVKFTIIDNGIGINPKYVDKVFQVFHRLEPLKYDGMGMGLTIAQKIIGLHNGNMWIDKKYNDGFKIEFVLPSRGDFS